MTAIVNTSLHTVGLLMFVWTVKLTSRAVGKGRPESDVCRGVPGRTAMEGINYNLQVTTFQLELPQVSQVTVFFMKRGYNKSEKS